MKILAVTLSLVLSLAAQTTAPEKLPPVSPPKQAPQGHAPDPRTAKAPPPAGTEPIWVDQPQMKCSMIKDKKVPNTRCKGDKVEVLSCPPNQGRFLVRRQDKWQCVKGPPMNPPEKHTGPEYPSQQPKPK